MITSIQTNIQGQTTTTELGRLTLLLGPNASGKDRVLRAVALALTGTVDDLLGKDEVASSTALFPLATDNQIRAVATLTDGTIAEYALNFKADGSANKPVRNGPPGLVLSLRAVREVFTKNDAGQRAFYMTLAGQYAQITEADVLNEIAAPLRELYGQVAQSVRVSVQEPPVETLGKVVREAKRLAQEKTKEIGQAEAALSAVGGDARIVTDAELEQHRRTRETITNRLSEIGNVPTPVDPVTLTTALEATAKQAAEDIATMQNADMWLAANPEPEVHPDADTAARFWSAMELVASSYRGGMQCPLSGGVVNESVRQNTIQMARVSLDLNAQTTKARTDWLPQAAHYRNLREAVLQSYTAAGQRYQALQERITQNNEIAARYQAVGAERVRLQNELTQVSEHIARAQATRDQSARLSRLRTDIEQASEQKDKLRRLVDAAEAVETRLLTTTVGTFEAAVNKFLPELPNGGRFSIDQSGDKFRVGLLTDTGLRTALSGAEWNILTLAIGLAIADRAPNKLHVLVPEDRGYDPVTLTAWMEQIARASTSGQVLLASTVAPLRTVDGWTVVRSGTDRPTPPPESLDEPRATWTPAPPLSAPVVTTTKGPDGYWRATVDGEPVVDNAVSIFATEQGAKAAAAREIASAPSAVEPDFELGMSVAQAREVVKRMHPDIKRLTDKRLFSELDEAGFAVGADGVLVAAGIPHKGPAALAEGMYQDAKGRTWQLSGEIGEHFRLTNDDGEVRTSLKPLVAQAQVDAFVRVTLAVVESPTMAEVVANPAVMDVPEPENFVFEQHHCTVRFEGRRWEGTVLVDGKDHLAAIGKGYEDTAEKVREFVRSRNDAKPSPEAKPPASCPLGPVGKFVWRGNYADIGRVLNIFVGSQARVDKADEGNARWEKYANGALVYVTATGAAVWSGTAQYQVGNGQIGVV